MELISHKNSSKGRSQEQRTGPAEKKWERSGLPPHLPFEPHRASMPASALVRGVEYSLQIFLSNLAGPLTNAVHDISAVHFQGGRGKGRPLPCSGSRMLHFISIPCTCNAVSEGTEPGRHARGQRGKPSLNRRALSSSRWGQRALSSQVPKNG